MIEGFRQFESWLPLRSWVAIGCPTYYKAPMDLLPRRVRVEPHGTRIKVTPLFGRHFDPFVADETHLERFYIHDQAPSSDVDPPEEPTRQEATRQCQDDLIAARYRDIEDGKA